MTGITIMSVSVPRYGLDEKTVATPADHYAISNGLNKRQSLHYVSPMFHIINNPG